MSLTSVPVCQSAPTGVLSPGEMKVAAERPANARRVLLIGAALALAFAIRIPIVLGVAHQRGFSWTWGGEQFSIANAMLHGRGFSSPYSPPGHPFTGPTAQQTPIYPAIVAALAVFGGSMAFAARAALALGLLCSTLTTLPIIAIGERVRVGLGLVAGVAWALSPILGYSDAGYLWDTAFYTAALSGILWMLVSLADAARRPASSSRWFVWGIAAGATLLIDPAHLLVLGAVWCALIGTHRVSRRAVVAAALGGLFVVGPWLARNRAMLGHASFKSNLGYEVVRGLSTNPFDPASGARIAAMNPGRNLLEFQRYAALGETRYMAEQSHAAMLIVGHRPMALMGHSAERVAAYWAGGYEVASNPMPIGAAGKHLVFLAPGVLALIGLVLLWRRRKAHGGTLVALFISLCVIFPLPYYLTITQPRYRAPLDPWLLVLATYAVMQLRRAAVPAGR